MEAAGPLALADSPKRLLDPLLESAVYRGAKVLDKIGRAAIERLLKDGAVSLHTNSVFTAEELQELIDTILAGVGTAELLGRARVRVRFVDKMRERGEDPLNMFRIREDISPQPPEKALDFFSRLVPSLGTDPGRFGDSLRRRAFTMASATSKTVLDKVQQVIRDRLATGKDFGSAPKEIDAILDEAGISRTNPQYSEMVFRTNVIDSYNQGFDDEIRDPEIQETFPVWMYSNPADTNSRKTHAAKDGKYWPSSVQFLAVRGTGIEDAANCRCTPIMVDKWEWERLQQSGVKTEVPMPPRPPAQAKAKLPQDRDQDPLPLPSMYALGSGNKFRSSVTQSVKSPTLTPEQARRYETAANSVVDQMPEVVRKRLDANADKVQFYPDAKQMGVAAMNDTLRENPDLPAAQREQIAAFRDEVARGDYVVAGVYSPTRKQIYLDGPLSGDLSRPALVGPYGGEVAHEREVYAHEFTHALDGPDLEISGSEDWQSVWKKEIHGDFMSYRLTEYGATNATEGFAEFGRLLYGTDIPLEKIERDFPEASKFFKSKGYWPTRATAVQGEIEEKFSADLRIDLGGNAHADVLLPPRPSVESTVSAFNAISDASLGGGSMSFAEADIQISGMLKAHSLAELKELAAKVNLAVEKPTKKWIIEKLQDRVRHQKTLWERIQFRPAELPGGPLPDPSPRPQETRTPVLTEAEKAEIERVLAQSKAEAEAALAAQTARLDQIAKAPRTKATVDQSVTDFAALYATVESSAVTFPVISEFVLGLAGHTIPELKALAAKVGINLPDVSSKVAILDTIERRMRDRKAMAERVSFRPLGPGQ